MLLNWSTQILHKVGKGPVLLLIGLIAIFRPFFSYSSLENAGDAQRHLTALKGEKVFLTYTWYGTDYYLTIDRNGEFDGGISCFFEEKSKAIPQAFEVETKGELVALSTTYKKYKLYLHKYVLVINILFSKKVEPFGSIYQCDAWGPGVEGI